MDPITLALQPTKRQQRAEMFNHALPGVILLITGVTELFDGNPKHPIATYLEIFAGAAVLLAMRFESKRKAAHGHALVNFVDIFAGVVLFVEGLNIYHPNKWFQPAHGYFFIGVVTMAKGVFHSSLPQVRRIIVDEHGFMVKTSLFRNVRMAWKDVASLRTNNSNISVKTHSGKFQTISLRRVGNKEEVFTLVTTRASSKGITIDQ